MCARVCALARLLLAAGVQAVPGDAKGVHGVRCLRAAVLSAAANAGGRQGGAGCRCPRGAPDPHPPSLMHRPPPPTHGLHRHAGLALRLRAHVTRILPTRVPHPLHAPTQTRANSCPCPSAQERVLISQAPPRPTKEFTESVAAAHGKARAARGRPPALCVCPRWPRVWGAPAIACAPRTPVGRDPACASACFPSPHPRTRLPP
jgi:hypothetical protein